MTMGKRKQQKKEIPKKKTPKKKKQTIKKERSDSILSEVDEVAKQNTRKMKKFLRPEKNESFRIVDEGQEFFKLKVFLALPNRLY